MTTRLVEIMECLGADEVERIRAKFPKETVFMGARDKMVVRIPDAHRAAFLLELEQAAVALVGSARGESLSGGTVAHLARNHAAQSAAPEPQATTTSNAAPKPTATNPSNAAPFRPPALMRAANPASAAATATAPVAQTTAIALASVLTGHAKATAFLDAKMKSKCQIR